MPPAQVNLPQSVLVPQSEGIAQLVPPVPLLAALDAPPPLPPVLADTLPPLPEQA